MNNERRKYIQGISELLEDAQGQIAEVQQQEQDYYDEMPEGLQGSEKGDRATEVADELMDIDSGLQDIIDRLEGCKE